MALQENCHPIKNQQPILCSFKYALLSTCK